MSLKLTSVAVALAMTVSLAPAHAAPVAEFSDFRSICIAAEGNRSASLAFADQAGWMPIPDTMLQQITKPMRIGEVDGRVRSSKSGLAVLIVGIRALGQFPADACIIGTQGADLTEIKSQATAFAAVPPVPGLSIDGRLGFVWRDVGGLREAVSQLAMERMSRPPAGLKAMVVGPMAGGFSALIYFVPRSKAGT